MNKYRNIRKSPEFEEEKNKDNKIEKLLLLVDYDKTKSQNILPKIAKKKQIKVKNDLNNSRILMKKTIDKREQIFIDNNSNSNRKYCSNINSRDNEIINTNSFLVNKSALSTKNSKSIKKIQITKTKKLFKIESLSQMGTKIINQDSILVLQNIFNLEHFAICSVFDGHGQNGHFISTLAKNIFKSYFSSDSNLYYIPRTHNQSCINTMNTSNNDKVIKNLNSLKEYISETDVHSKLSLNNYHIIHEVYKQIEKEIKDSEYDKEFSGTTSCSVFITGNYLICSNIGDSRAIMISQRGKVITPLSTDHKPNNPKEKNRIIKHGGEVRINYSSSSTLCQENYPFRVYAPEKDYPGLAISRSLGDFVAKNIGVNFEDDIIDIQIGKDDMCIVIGSDGLWDHLTEEEVAKIVSKYYDSKNNEDASKELVNEARRRYELNGNYIDDVSVIIVFLYYNS